MPPDVEFSDNFQDHSENQEAFIDILQQMFPDYDQVIIDREFAGSSFSGSWVFEVHLIRDGKKNLPVVVKIASISLIEKEWQAYHKYIAGKWPRVTELETNPVIARNKKLGGLYYSLAGEGVFPVQSLYSYCLAAPVKDIEAALSRLARIIEHVIIYNSEKRFNFRLRAGYDAILPINLLIKPAPIPAETTLVLIKPDALPDPPLKSGTYVRLEAFAVTKIDLKDKTITLNLPRSEPDLPDDAYHIRLQFDSAEIIPVYTIGQTIPMVEGQVLTTRADQWQTEMDVVMDGHAFDWQASTVSLPHSRYKLPNPFALIYRDNILNQRADIRVSTIHGDLNLENILVDPEVGVIHLIDFAEADWDYVLHDMLRLETEVVSKLVWPALHQAKLPPETIRPFYEHLHYATFQLDPKHYYIGPPHPSLERAFTALKVIRQMARNHGLFNPRKYDEYYTGLTLYLLGALKFRNLTAPAKQVLFWGAATIQHLQHNPLPNIKLTPNEALPVQTEPLSPSQQVARLDEEDESTRPQAAFSRYVWAAISLLILSIGGALAYFGWLWPGFGDNVAGTQAMTGQEQPLVSKAVPPPTDQAIPTSAPVSSQFAIATPLLGITSGDKATPTMTTGSTPTTTATAMSDFARPELVFGEEGIAPGYFIDPRRIALDGTGHIYIGEWKGNRIQKFDASGNFISLWNTVDDGPVTGLAATRQGEVYVLQRNNISQYDGGSGEFQGQVGYNDTFAQQANTQAIIIGPNDRLITLATSGLADHLVRFDDEGQVTQVTDISTPTESRFSLFSHLATDGLGNVYVGASDQVIVYKFGPEGQFIDKFGSQGEDPGQFRVGPNALAIDAQGRVFVSASWYIHVFEPNGRFIDRFETVEAGVAGGMAFDQTNQLFVVLYNKRKVVKFVIDGL